jgi:hypothetical protein
MSTVKANRLQLGQSGTATQNFTLDASAADGTMKLARGVAGGTTQDVMLVNAAGEVDFPQLVRLYGSNGYQKMPGGLILQWGASTTPAGGTIAVAFPIIFPNALFQVYAADYSVSNGTTNIIGCDAGTVNGCNVYTSDAAGTAQGSNFKWFAIGN